MSFTINTLYAQEEEATYQELMIRLEHVPCDATAREELARIGDAWRVDPARNREALAIYELLAACDPENAEWLFYWGQQLARAGRWDEAEQVLKRCLEMNPHDSDAEVQLGYVYLWKGEWAQAEAILSRFPEQLDAERGLARALQQQGKSEEAQVVYRRILANHPHEIEAQRELARSLASDLQFHEADAIYAGFVDDDPNQEQHWQESFDVQAHTRPALYVESLYTDAKENDPSLRVPVVKDYYFFNATHLFIPCSDRWRLDLQQLYYHQRENDLYPPTGVNYSVYLTGAQITSSFFFRKDWKWDLSARGFQAWGKKEVTYPFHQTTRFEPGTSLLYNSERQLFVVDAHIESRIIKNFAAVRSELLRTDCVTAAYGYRIPVALHPEVEAWVTHVWIHDSMHNWNNSEIGIARLGVPYLSRYVTALYRFEHAHFHQLNPNYYSFKQQLRNVLGVKMQYHFSPAASWEAVYEHRWETTYQLFQPIGNFLFVASKQYLVGNRITSRASYRWKDHVQIALEGHYFHTTLVYRDWNLNGSVLWQF